MRQLKVLLINLPDARLLIAERVLTGNQSINHRHVTVDRCDAVVRQMSAAHSVINWRLDSKLWSVPRYLSRYSILFKVKQIVFH